MTAKQSQSELEDRRKYLEERLQKIKDDIRQGLNQDFEEQAVELENRDVLLEIARVTEEELEKVKQLLQE